MKDWKRWLPGAVISILLIAAILYVVDLRAMMAAFRHANFAFLVYALSTGFVWIAVRAQVWRTLLRNRPAYSDVFWTVGEGYLLNNFLPFGLGEIGRVFLLNRKTDMKFMEILPTVIIERITDLGFSALVFLAALPFVIGSEASGTIGIVVGVIVFILLLMMYVLARYNQWALDLFHKLSARWPKIQSMGGNFLGSFFQGLGVLTDGWLFIRFIFWMTLNWAIAVVAYYFIFRAYFPETQIVWAMFGLGAAAFGGAIPSLPGAVGTFEGALAGALTLLTGDPATSLAAALTARMYNYVNSLVIGAIGFARDGETLSGIYQQLRNFRIKESNEQ